MSIPFNTPALVGKEIEYIRHVLELRKLSGNGFYTKKIHQYFHEKFSFQKPLLTSSCTDALEMAAILCNISEGDEVIMPSYTFVSTANAFVLRGAKLVFVDSRSDHPGFDENQIEALITSRTKAIVPVHYAGVACDMDKIMALAAKYDLFVIEDAAQSIDSYYRGRPLGSIGDFSTFSFHETKNVISGEGGMLVVNKPEQEERSEIIWEKGTNRAAFWRGEVDKYGWVDVGSSFLPSELTAAFLFAQLENLESIQSKRLEIWNAYHEQLEKLKERITLPSIPEYATNNAHMYYLVCADNEERTALLKHLSDREVNAVFHYQSLHDSEFYRAKHDGRVLEESDRYTNCLLRLPMHLNMSEDDVLQVSNAVIEFYK